MQFKRTEINKKPQQLTLSDLIPSPRERFILLSDSLITPGIPQVNTYLLLLSLGSFHQDAQGRFVKGIKQRGVLSVIDGTLGTFVMEITQVMLLHSGPWVALCCGWERNLVGREERLSLSVKRWPRLPGEVVGAQSLHGGGTPLLWG